MQVKVSEIMNRRFHFVQTDAQVWEVQNLMLRFRQSYMIVVDGNEEKLVGIITHSDIFRKLLPSQEDFMEKLENRLIDGFSDEDYQRVCDLSVRDLMTRNPLTITPQMSIIRAGALMNARRFKQLPVGEGNKIVGVLHQSDIQVALMLGLGSITKPG